MAVEVTSVAIVETTAVLMAGAPDVAEHVKWDIRIIGKEKVGRDTYHQTYKMAKCFTSVFGTHRSSRELNTRTGPRKRSIASR